MLVDLPEYRNRVAVYAAARISDYSLLTKLGEVHYDYAGICFVSINEPQIGDIVMVPMGGDDLNFLIDRATLDMKYTPNTKENWDDTHVEGDNGFEWAFAQARCGIPIRRKSWHKGVLIQADLEDGKQVLKMGKSILWRPDQEDLFATDWEAQWN